MILSSILTIDPDKVDRDLSFFMRCFREVLEEAGEQALASSLPWQGVDSAPLATISAERLSQAYSIAFQLLSMVEQNAAVQHQRSTEVEHGLAAIQALWGQCLQQMHERNLSDRQIAAEFERTRQMLERVYGGTLAERRPNIHGMLQMRREALRTLHRQQIVLLRRWRELRQRGDHDEAASLLPHLLLTVNAIASGLGTTG